MSDAPGYNRICRIRMRLPRESRITIAHPRRIRGATPRNKTDRNTSRDCGIHRQTPLILENERSSQVNAKRPLNEFENQEPFVGHPPRYRLARFSSTRSISHRAALQVAVPGRGSDSCSHSSGWSIRRKSSSRIRRRRSRRR